MGTDCGLVIKKKSGEFIKGEDLSRWFHFVNIPQHNVLYCKTKMLSMLLDCFIELHNDEEGYYEQDVLTCSRSIAKAVIDVKNCDDDDLIGFWIDGVDCEEEDFKIYTDE